MKTEISKYFFILTVSFLTLSCVKVLDYDIPDDEKRIVVNSHFSVNDTFKAHIYKSLHILDRKGIKAIDNAVIQIFEDDVFLTEINHGPTGNYKGLVPFKPGNTYTLSVSAPGLGTATSSTTIPFRYKS
ncbi:MAG: DUF4249 family protein [Bacteroidales bacterium]|nr:DUF4249 family protein [Bacteroidales bacterium]